MSSTHQYQDSQQISGAGILFIPNTNNTVFVSKPNPAVIPNMDNSNKNTPILINLSELNDKHSKTTKSDSVKPGSSSSSPRPHLVSMARANPAIDICDIQSIIDAATIRNSVSKKRFLETKLKNRPSKYQLIQRGILPPANSPAKFLKQRIKLERAKMCDLLKHKIERRPEKKQLISKHILLADSKADPIIQERQVQLKRCKLADSLNDKLAHRPGPLELVQENILHVDDALQLAVKEGRLPFKPTSAGLIQKHPHPVLLLEQDGTLQYSTEINDSTVMLASLDMSGPEAGSCLYPMERGVSAPATPAAPGSAGNTPPIVGTNSASNLPIGGGKASKGKFKRPKSAASKTLSSASQPYGSVTSPSQMAAVASKGGNSKIIKFHEYKGPQTSNGCLLNSPLPLTSFGNTMINTSIPCDSNTGKFFTDSSCVNSPSTDGGSPQSQPDSKETSYELLLQQQQLFLQWQLELKQKYPNSVIQLMPMSAAAAAVAQQNQQKTSCIPVAVPADTCTGPTQLQAMDHCVFMQNNCDSMDTCHSQTDSCVKESAPLVQPVSTPAPVSKSSNVPVNVSKLEDLRVADLKAECKKRNLPVSGPKPALLERMRPYEDVIVASFQKPPDADSTTSIDDLHSSDVKPPAPAPSSAPPPIPGSLQPPMNGTLLLQPSPSASDLRSVSSDTSGIASNYSSPGIDLSSLSFSQAQAANSASSSGSISCFTFASQGSGGQFTLANPTSTGSSTISTSQNSNYTISAQMTSVQTSMVNSNASAVAQCSGSLLMTGSPIVTMPHDAIAPSTTSATPPATMSLLNVLNPLNNAQGLSQENSTRIDGLTLTAMSATTLSLHEEMLKHQQKKIEELQKELQRSQEQLKHQQQVILAARKAQSERANGLTAPTDGKSPVEQAAEAWLAQIDTKHLQRFHIQLFLQHKLQQQQLQQQMVMQQELVATQTRLREELGVQQAVNEVGTLVRSEPRAAMLILQLLKRLQGQDLNTLPIANLLQNPNTSSPTSTAQNQQTPSTSTTCENGGLCSDSKPPAPVSKKKSKCKSSTAAVLAPIPAVTQASLGTDPINPYHNTSSMQGLLAPCPVNCIPPTTPVNCDAPVQYELNESSPDVCKSRQNSGSSSASIKKGAVRSHSLPLTPGKPSNVDMEEIFKSVMDLASQKLAASEVHEPVTDVDSPTNEANVQQRLPSCDQLIPPLRTTNGELSAPQSMALSANQQGMLQQLLMPPAAVPANSAHPLGLNQQEPLVYTRNDAFDDLMEVLRDNADINALQLGHDLDATQSLLTQGTGYPNTFGAQELADLIGPDWFETAAAAANAAQQNCIQQSIPESSPTNDAIPVVGQMQGREATEAINSYVQALHEQEVEYTSSAGTVPYSSGDPVQHIESNAVTVDYDFRNSFEQHNGDQMDWLDLILPSPSNFDLPTNPSGLVASANTMDIDPYNSILKSGPCNPVLTQSSLSRSDCSFDLTA